MLILGGGDCTSGQDNYGIKIKLIRKPGSVGLGLRLAF